MLKGDLHCKCSLRVFVSPQEGKFLYSYGICTATEALEWAESVIEKEQYTDHNRDSFTHSYMDSNNNHMYMRSIRFPT
jgi:hypothetical protein